MGPGMGMGMDHLADDLGGAHIETIEPQFPHGGFEERPAKAVRGPSFRRASDGNAKSLSSYEGYVFTKLKAEGPGQKETWALARKAIMPVSQEDLKEQVTKQYRKNMTGMKQLEAPEMQGFKRLQVQRLVEDRSRRDDPNFQYLIKSIKLERRRLRTGNYEFSEMRVILKRQLRMGVPVHPAMAVVGPPSAPSEIVDLTGQDESEKSSMNSFGSPPKHHGAIPLPRQHSESWVHGGHGGHSPQIVDDRFVPISMPHGRPLGEEQGHPKHHAGPFFPEDAFHGGHGEKDLKHDRKDKHEKPEKHEKGDKHDKKDKSDKYDKYDKHDRHDKHDNKESRPTIIHLSSHKSDKKHYSSSSSFDSDWDHLSRDTEDTFESIPTHSSSASKTYKKEKKYYKPEKTAKDDSHRRHSPGDHSEERGKPLYREHRRKAPEKPRDISPPPTRRYSRPHSHYYQNEEVLVTPEISHHGSRVHEHRDPRPRQVSYDRERPVRPAPSRRISVREDDMFDMEYDSPPRSTTYARNLMRPAKAPQVDYEKESLKIELELERERHNRTQEELHRTKSARVPVRERMPAFRERRPPPIIEREPLPPLRRRAEPEYEYYDDGLYY